MKVKLINNDNLKRIHVNRHTMTRNWKQKVFKEAIGVEYYEAGKKQKAYAHDVRVIGPTRIIQSQKPLSCGAKCWIETHANVELTTWEGKENE